MPDIHGRNALIVVWDSTGACRNLGGDTNNVAFSWSKDNPDKTTLGKDSHQRMSGLRDLTITLAGIWNSDASQVHVLADALMTGSMLSLIHYAMANQSGCPKYCACMVINSYELQSPVNGVTPFTAAFQLASGSVSASTV